MNVILFLLEITAEQLQCIFTLKENPAGTKLNWCAELCIAKIFKSVSLTINLLFPNPILPL